MNLIAGTLNLLRPVLFALGLLVAPSGNGTEQDLIRSILEDYRSGVAALDVNPGPEKVARIQRLLEPVVGRYEELGPRRELVLWEFIADPKNEGGLRESGIALFCKHGTKDGLMMAKIRASLERIAENGYEASDGEPLYFFMRMISREGNESDLALLEGYTRGPHAWYGGRYYTILRNRLISEGKIEADHVPWIKRYPEVTVVIITGLLFLIIVQVVRLLNRRRASRFG